MKTEMLKFREEEARDVDTIRDLTKRAFEPMRFSDGTEPKLIDDLRDASALTLSLVAEDEAGKVIAQVTFSPVSFEPAASDKWLGLGPIAVEPELQKSGIGRALMAEALDRVKALGFEGVGLIGNPAVYAGSGFVSTGRLTYKDVPPKIVQAISFTGDIPEGELVFHPAFD